MKRSRPLPRHKALPRSAKPMKRRTRLNPHNPERAAKQFQRAYHSDAFCDWVRSLGCCVPCCNSSHIEVAHVTSRGAGGTWEDVVPLCAKHHRAQHDMGMRSFERYVGFSLADVAAQVTMRWRAFTKDAA